jgi:hypothetical protein
MNAAATAAIAEWTPACSLTGDREYPLICPNENRDSVSGTCAHKGKSTCPVERPPGCNAGQPNGCLQGTHANAGCKTPEQCPYERSLHME